MDNKKRNKVIIYSVLGIAALAFVFKKFKAKQSSQTDIGSGGNSGGGSGGVSPVGNMDYRSLSNQIFDAVDGYGTDNEKIKRIFKLLKTDSDYDALKAAYGIREVSSGRGNFFVSNYEGDLASTLRDEMTDSEIAELNQILTSNRISRTI